MFVTGSPGSGKSFFVRILKDFLYQILAKRALITSSTNQSASIIFASSLHSTLGIGLGTMTVKQMVERVKKSLELNQLFLSTKVGGRVRVGLGDRRGHDDRRGAAPLHFRDLLRAQDEQPADGRHAGPPSHPRSSSAAILLNSPSKKVESGRA